MRAELSLERFFVGCRLAKSLEQNLGFGEKSRFSPRLLGYNALNARIVGRLAQHANVIIAVDTFLPPANRQQRRSTLLRALRQRTSRVACFALADCGARRSPPLVVAIVAAVLRAFCRINLKMENTCAFRRRARSHLFLLLVKLRKQLLLDVHLKLQMVLIIKSFKKQNALCRVYLEVRSFWRHFL